MRYDVPDVPAVDCIVASYIPKTRTTLALRAALRIFLEGSLSKD